MQPRPPPFQPVVINFLSHKGGGGRTTSAMTIAAALLLQGRNVLVVDMDFEAPGLTMFNGNGSEGDWIRLEPETLRPLAINGEWRPPHPDATQVALPGLNDALAEAIIARSGGDVLLVNRRGNFRDNLDRITGWWQSGERSRADDAPAVEAAIAECVASGRHVYEYVPVDTGSERATDLNPALRLPGRLFVLPFGGRFRKRTQQWIYDSDPVALGERARAEAEALVALLGEDLTRELARRDVNLTTALIDGIGRLMRGRRDRLDAVLIDHRPGADVASHRLGTVGHGTIFVTAATRGALAGAWDAAEKLIRLCLKDWRKSGKRGVAPVAGFLVEKLIPGVGQAQDSEFGEPFRKAVRAIGLDATIKQLTSEGSQPDSIAAFRTPLTGSAWRTSLRFALAPLVGGRIGLATSPLANGPESLQAAWQITPVHQDASDLENAFQSLVPIFFDEEGFPFFERSHDLARWSVRMNVRDVVESTDTSSFNSAMFSLVASTLRDLATEEELGKFIYFKNPPRDPVWEIVRALGQFDSKKNVNELARVIREFGDINSEDVPAGAEWMRPYHLAEACLLIAGQIQQDRLHYAAKARELCALALKWYDAGHVTTQYIEARWAIEGLRAQAQIVWAELGQGKPLEILSAFREAVERITYILKDDRDERNSASISWIFRSLPRQTTVSAQTALRNDRRRRLFRVSLSWVNALFTETGSLRGAAGMDEPKAGDLRDLQMLQAPLEAWAAASGLPSPSKKNVSLDAYLDLGDSSYGGLADLAELARSWLDIDIFAGLGSALTESIARAADEYWPQLQRSPRVRARLLPLLVVQGWMASLDYEDLTRKTHDVERATLVLEDPREGHIAAIWCGIALMELAQERAESDALDAALDFARRAAAQFSHAAQAGTRPAVWFLLMAARAFARIVTEEQRRRRFVTLSEEEQKRDNFVARLSKAVRTLDRDAFYAFEQWESLRRARISKSGSHSFNTPGHPINHYFDGSVAATLSKVPIRVIQEIVEGLGREFESANGRGIFRALPAHIRRWMETAWALAKDKDKNKKVNDMVYASAKEAWLSYP